MHSSVFPDFYLKYVYGDLARGLNRDVEMLIFPYKITHASECSFPENQGDALLLEVQDMKKNTLGRTSIPVSAMADNNVCLALLYVIMF